MHLEDLKDGRAFVAAARATVPEEAGRRPEGGAYGRRGEGRRLAHRRARG